MIEFMPRVCADFYDRNRNLLFRITREDLGKYIKAPYSIQEDSRCLRRFCSSGYVHYYKNRDVCCRNYDWNWSGL